ncbi:MAG TPA: hypothetical protein VFQ61_04145 [Polyangiaceae bacterium]|nr:hypothetical protein [Polyangiaceae bacterium]
MTLFTGRWIGVPLVLLLGFACNSEPSSGSSTTGQTGGVGQGGSSQPGQGGASQTGGTLENLGATSTYGGTAVSSGGAPTSGGATAQGGTPDAGGGTTSGGAANAGGAPSGGSAGGTAAGGTVYAGTNSGGASSSGESGGTAGAGAGGSSIAGGSGGGGSAAHAMMNFFVTSDSKTDANLGGLAGADQRCQRLAAAVGHGSKTWHAYLSVGSPMTHAKDRIGPGPYYNSKGELLASDKTALHARSGDAALFLDEKGNRVNGQWAGSPTPNQHDILTGSQRDGTLATGMTCGDWTSTTGSSQVGHSDGLGPGMQMGMYVYWNSVHTGQCGDTAPGGGAGKLYCFTAE